MALCSLYHPGCLKKVDKMTTFISKDIERRALEEKLGHSQTVYRPPMAPHGRNLGPKINCKEVSEYHQRSDFANFVKDGAWKGRRCFLVGGGPSLKTFDWSLLDGELAIAVNRAFEFFNPSITFSMDSRYFTWNQMGKANGKSEYHPEVPERFWKMKCMKTWVQISKRAFPEGIYTLLNAGPIGLTKLMSDGVATGENSGFAALNLALNLGASPIYLLGYDMKGNDAGKQAHFHSGYPSIMGAHVYSRTFIPYFEKAACEIKSRGCQVINLSATSALDCFEKQEFPEESKVPVIVSFYTENTGYEREADFLMRSCVAHGMPFDIQALPAKESWIENCSMKPGFILDMMGKYPDRPIVWLDADATIEQRPLMFEKIGPSIDFACCHTEFIKEVGMQVASGMLYFAPTPKAKDLVVRWNYRCKEDIDVWDQAHLQSIMMAWDGKRTILPDAYCHLFDNGKEPVGGVVIMQHQASRRLRKAPIQVQAEIAPSAIAESDSVALKEKDKYADLWSNQNYKPSQTQGMIAQALLTGGFTQGDILEFGCGNGAAVEMLISKGLNVQGMDVTLAGLVENRNGHYTEAALWDLPFGDKNFDMTYSTDVLEHLPPDKIEAAIKEILRVSKRITVHIIATFSCEMYGQELHLTQQPIKWWKEQFAKSAEANLYRGKYLVVDRADFMKKGLK